MACGLPRQTQSSSRAHPVSQNTRVYPARKPTRTPGSGTGERGARSGGECWLVGGRGPGPSSQAALSCTQGLGTGPGSESPASRAGWPLATTLQRAGKCRPGAETSSQAQRPQPSPLPPREGEQTGLGDAPSLVLESHCWTCGKTREALPALAALRARRRDLRLSVPLARDPLGRRCQHLIHR